MALLNMQPEHPFEDYQRREKIKYLDVKPNWRILDVGGGDGSVWKQVTLPYDVKIDLIEPDDSLRAKASASGVYDNVYESDWHFRAYSDRKYDCCTILGVLEHLEKPLDLLLAFNNIPRMYLTVPNAESYHRYVGRAMGVIESLTELGPQDLAIGHKRVFTPHSFEELIWRFNQFCIPTKYKYQIKTTTFKFLDSTGMMEFTDKFDAMNAAALASGIIGDGLHGAELVAILDRT